MRTSSMIAAALACAVLIGAGNTAGSEAAPAPAPAPAAAPDAASGVRSFQPGFDDLMTMLVQPRHLKLFYAGTQRNWELAAAELNGLRSALARVVAGFPSYQEVGVEEAVSTIIGPKLEAVGAAIAAADSRRFASAYGELTAACNACHAYMERPFLVITVPSSAGTGAYPDQEFSPRP